MTKIKDKKKFQKSNLNQSIKNIQYLEIFNQIKKIIMILLIIEINGSSYVSIQLHIILF